MVLLNDSYKTHQIGQRERGTPSCKNLHMLDFFRQNTGYGSSTMEIGRFLMHVNRLQVTHNYMKEAEHADQDNAYENSRRTTVSRRVLWEWKKWYHEPYN